MPARPPTTLHDLLQRRLDPGLYHLLLRIAEAAVQRGQALYLVGGVVRDLLLGRPTQDLDLVIEGDAHALARSLARRMEGRAVIHRRFGTARLYVESRQVDLAMARTERYPKPGALPQVAPGSITQDLRRRDFTINAMAVSVAPSDLGRLLDPLGGQADLRAGLIRVIHDASFLDDPTRIPRALRYQARFGFSLEKTTQALLVRDARNLDAVSGDRVRHELERTLAEAEPEKALSAAAEAGVLQAIHPALRWNGDLSAWAARARQMGLATRGVYWALWGLRGTEQDARAVARRLRLPTAMAQPFLRGRELYAQLPTLRKADLRPSQLAALLEGFPDEAIAACRVAADSPIIDQRLRLYTESLRGMRAHLDGRDLLALGVPQGPALGKMLAGLKAARLDGRVSSREDEVALVRRWVESGAQDG